MSATDQATAQSHDAGQMSDKNGWMVTVLASMMIITASFVNFLTSNNYPLLRPEVAIVGFGIFVLTILVGLLHHRMSYLGKGLLEGLLVLIILNQNGLSVLYASIAAALVAIFVRLASRSTLSFFGVLALFTLIAGLLGIGKTNSEAPAHPTAIDSSPSNPASTKPAVVHLILDEHIGIEGLPTDNPGSPAMKEQLREFYLSRGFKLYGRGYSQHYHTVNSLPQIMNLGETQPPFENALDGGVIRKNAYFDALEKQGYKIHVTQSSFLDFCQNDAVNTCSQYSHAGMGAIAALPNLTTTGRAQFIALRFFLLSDVTRSVGVFYRFAEVVLDRRGISIPGFGLSTRGLASTVNALPSFDRFNQSLAQAKPGEAYIAHMLLPHYPFATNEDCSVKPIASWHYRLSDEPRKARENAYFDQLRCSMKKVEAALGALSKSPAKDNFVVIIHGDHGSRITKREPTAPNLDKFDDNDLITGFSTILAVRGSGLNVGYEERAVSVSQIVSSLSKSEFKAVPAASEHRQLPVYLDNPQWVPTEEVSLPKKW